MRIWRTQFCQRPVRFCSSDLSDKWMGKLKEVDPLRDPWDGFVVGLATLPVQRLRVGPRHHLVRAESLSTELDVSRKRRGLGLRHTRRGSDRLPTRWRSLSQRRLSKASTNASAAETHAAPARSLNQSSRVGSRELAGAGGPAGSKVALHLHAG